MGVAKELDPTQQLNNNNSEDPKIPIAREVGMTLETDFNFQTPIFFFNFKIYLKVTSIYFIKIKGFSLYLCIIPY